jgi:hypothetical protein
LVLGSAHGRLSRGETRWNDGMWRR